jgi:hypothetical protein
VTRAPVRALHQSVRQIGQHAAGPDYLLLTASARQQLIDQLIAKVLANLNRQIVG